MNGQQQSLNSYQPNMSGQPNVNGQHPHVRNTNNQQWGDPNSQVGDIAFQPVASQDSKDQRVGYSDGAADDERSNTAGSTPLSPTSAEILGKLRKSNGENSDESAPHRGGKTKRPQPVVDAAYRYVPSSLNLQF